MLTIKCKCRYRNSPAKSIKTQEASNSNPTSTHEHDDPDYNGLKYNMLYVSADHQDVLEGNYHTVENDQPPIHKKVSEHDINYSTVDDVADTSFNTAPTHKIVRNAQKGQGYDDTRNTENSKVKHHFTSADNSNVYSVVDKKKRIVVDDNCEPIDRSQTYAVVDKTRTK